ncbi:hypothetical protein Vqi01_48090 [Micromonospora qiuiae]|uniref:Calpain catalytic domain-containing protein n=1 Tax=Micromonospora qiuiae TaxID=502268 RepID=A0ABQ4JJI0_9ACTN|nr:YwqJ-related putative deaminase [Micromonospora qiuiae]GIJ29647.1 hypothetical protein Vqi01_48090 [Micromonospora qiuiae]
MAVPNPRGWLGDYAWVWDAICWVGAGEGWPSGDEDKMRELADAWQGLAEAVNEALFEADPAVMKILQSWGGGAGEAFGGLWNQLGVDPNNGLPLIQEVAAAYASGCDQAALEIEYAKLTVLIAVMITVIAVFVALLMAWLGGVSAGAIPGILAGGRQAVTIAFRRLIAQMGRQLLTRAGMQTALRTAGTRLGRFVTSQGFRQGMTRLGRELLEEIGEELIIDVGAQAYQMHTGERRQWDGKRTLTAGVGGAYGAVLGTGLHWAGRRVAPRMPVSFSPSRLSFPGSGVVRWGSTSITSGAQNAIISPAASVLANGTINGQWAMPGADAFLGGFASGAGRTGATMIGSGAGTMGAKITNWGLGKLGVDFTPGAGLGAGGIDPSLGVGGTNGLGNLGGTNGASGGTGAGSTGSGSTSGAGSSGGANSTSGAGSSGGSGSTSGAGSSGGANSTTGGGSTGSSTSGNGAGSVPTSSGSTSGGGGTAGSANTDTGGATQTGAGSVPASGSGSINLAPPPVDGSGAPSVDGSGAPSVDGSGAPSDGGTPPASPTADTGQKVTAEGPAAPVSDQPGTDRPTSGSTDQPGTDRRTSGATDQTGGAGPRTEAGTSTSGDAATGPARTSTGTPTTVVADPGPVGNQADPVVSDTPPMVLPGGSPLAAPTAGLSAGNVTPAGPTAPTNPAPTVSQQPAGPPTGPQAATNPNAPTTTGAPTAGTTTPSGSTTTQAAPSRTTPAGPVVNPTAAHTAGSISLTPATAPTSTSPNPATAPQPGTPAQQGAASQPGSTPSSGRPEARTPVDPLAPAVPAQTAGTDPTTAPGTTASGTNAPGTTASGTNASDTTAPVARDGAVDPAADRADQAQRPTADGPVVAPVPASTGASHGGPTGPDTNAGQVNPETLKKSEGPTGRGTHSWHLDPTAVDGDPTGPDAERSLIEASRTLAETVRTAVKAATVSKGKRPGMAGALLMANGELTTHTSMTEDKGTKPPTQPSVHPLAQAALDRTAAALLDGVGGGHGKCAEVALVSDQLYRLEQQWRNAGEPGTFEQYALNAFEGAKIVTHQAKEAKSGGISYEPGHYRPPCRSCAHFLPQFNVEPLVDPDREVTAYQPPVPGVVGNGPLLSDSRPYGQPEGLVPPDQADQDVLDAAVPRDPATGRPTAHPDPRLGSWAGLVNDGGPDQPGRSTNCADVGLSVLSTWYGRPDVAAPTATSSEVERGSTARQEQALRASFGHQGSGTPALDAVADALRTAGHGAAALIITSWSGDGGAHTWNAVNHNGTVIWVDGQRGRLSDGDPLYADQVGDVWSIVLDAEGDPIQPARPDGSITTAVPPASTASDGLSDPGDRTWTVITASALPGTDFHGQGRAQPDPDAVLDRARSVIGQVAAHAGVSDVQPRSDGTYQVTRADGSTFDLRLTSGPVADRAVATGRFDADGVAVVTLSDRAADAIVERGLAHEVAELSALGRPSAPGAPTVDPLSPADLAELRTAAHQVAVADRWSRAAAQRELAAVVDRLGLRDGMLGAEQRLATVPDSTRTALNDVYPDWHTDRPGSKPASRLPAAPTSDARPTGLPRLRTYVLTHLTTNSMLTALAVKLTSDAGRPELALMLGVGGLVGAVATGPAKWLAKRAGLAAEDRRARHDARQEARSNADSDATTGEQVAGRTDDVGPATREVDSATARLDSQVEALGQRLDAEEGRRRLIGRTRSFTAPATTGPSPSVGRSGDPAASPGPANPVGLTPHEQGRLAELRALSAQRDAGTRWARPRATREIRALLDSLGLRQGTPGAEQRRELLPADVRSLADRFGGSRPAAVRERLRVIVDRRPAEGERPGKVAPWWMSTVENAPNVLAAGSIALVGDLIGQLRLGWFAITAGLTATASGAVVDPLMARREAAAKDARDTWDKAHPALPADALLTQVSEVVTGPVDAVTQRAAEVTRRAADLEQRVADLNRRLAESHGRNGVAHSFRRLLFGDPAWAGLPTPDSASLGRPGQSGDPATSTGPTSTSTGPTSTADPANRTRGPADAAAVQRLAELAARHESARGPARVRHARHLRAMLDQLGLRDGIPGAEQRRELLPAELRPVAERFGRRLVADKVTRIFVGRPADATDSDARPSNVPNAGVYAVEQTPGPLVQAATTVEIANAIQVAAGAGPVNMTVGGVLGSVRDLALKRIETAVKDARRKWDLEHPNPATDSTARVERVAGPTEAAVSDAARRLRVAIANLDRVSSAIDRLAAQQPAAGTPTPTPPTSRGGGTTRTDTSDSLRRADSWELQTAAHHVRNAGPMSLKPALRELYAVIDRLGLRDGMLGKADRLAGLPPEARQVVAEFGGDRASRPAQLRTLRAEQKSADNGRPHGVPGLSTYLLSSFVTTGVAGAAGTAIAIALASPLAPIIPAAALAAAPVIGMTKWYAKRAGLAADDVRTRFDARSEARSTADRVDQIIDRLQEPVRELEQTTAELETRLDAAEAATDRLTERLAGTHQRNGILGRLFGAFGRSSAVSPDPASPDPAAGQPQGGNATGRPDGGPDPDSGRITAAAVPNSEFHGLGRPAADPAAVLDVARAALPHVAPYAQVDAVVQVGPDLFEIRSAGQDPLTVRLTTGPLTDSVVAQSTRNPDGTFTVTVSDRAADHAVARALAHEVAELAALHESGRALTGPLDPGNVDGRIDPAGLTAHDRGRMAEIRLLAAAYAGADLDARLAVRAEIDALTDHLGLRVGDPDVRTRWALIPRDVLAHLMQLSVPSLSPDAVSAVLAGAPTLTEVERIRMIDYRSRLAPDFQVPQQAQLDARLRELAAEAEQTQSGMPRMPAFAGQIVGVPQAQLDRIRAVDPQLADRLANEGVYVDLTGRYDLRPYMVAGVPAIDLGAARPAFDLSTEAGRQAQLHEDRQRSRTALRGLHGDQAAALLANHDFHYQGTARWMGLVPNVLTEALRAITPVPPTAATTAETTAAQGPSGDVRVTADRVTLPADEANKQGPVYGPALDARTGQPPPLFDGPPKREDVQQGALGDCGMIAVIGSVAGHLPDTIAQMFHPNPDGSVDVLLHETGGPGNTVNPTGRQLRITVFPDVPLHANSNGRSAYADQSMVGTSWASLLEKAIAAVDRTWSQQRHDQWQQLWTARPDVDAAQAAPLGYARLGNGSTRQMQAELLSQLTGMPTRVSRLDSTPGREADAEAQLAALLAAGSPVLTGTLPAQAYQSQPNGKPPYGLYAGHAYEIVSVANGEVHLRNPWNSSHPSPIPVRAFLDLMSPWYAHVDLARNTVAALPNSDFHGQGRPAADPTAVVDRARLVLPTLAAPIGADQVVAVGPDVFEVRAPGLEPLRIRVTAGPLAAGTVAETTRNLDGTFTLAVSDRAADGVVDRAVVHEAAELLARHETGDAQVGLFDQGTADGPIDPAHLTAQDRGRLAELRLMAAWYAQADTTARLALRADIDALVDQLGLRWGTPEAQARLAALPADVWSHVMTLSLPAITPDAVASALAFNPNPTTVERFRAIDYRGRLAPDLQPPPVAELTAKLRELAVHGEQSQSSLPRMPALAGQIIGVPANLLDQIRRVDPQLADRVAAQGIYVDLTGRFDLRPYTLDGAPEFSLAPSAPAYDLNTPAGRKALLAEDRARVGAAFRAEYGSNPAAMAVLTTHDFHYLTDARRMALVPNALTEALRAMMPPDPDVEVEAAPTVTTSEIAVVADRVTLPDSKPGRAVEYGQAVDSRTGQPAPLFDGPPRREQVRQGMLGDCGMLASIAAVAGHRPAALAQLFQRNPDGTVDVLLHESTLLGDAMKPTGRRLRITVRPDVPLRSGTNGATAYADQSQNGSAWASLLEKALAAVDRTWTARQHEQWQTDWRSWHSKDHPHQAAPAGYARLNVGSTPRMQAQLLTQLTGAPSRSSVFDSRPGQEARVAQRLAALLAAGSPVITGTKPEQAYPQAIRQQLPFGLVPGHAYEVVAVSNGQVSLRNPWNRSHPAPMPVRDFLDLMSGYHAHLDTAPTAPIGQAVAAPGPVATDALPPGLSPPRPPSAVPSSPAPFQEPSDRAAGRPHRHSLGRTFVDDERIHVGYFALLGADGTVDGLLVVVSCEHGQRTAHWGAGGGQPGAGGSMSIGRAEAERIAREVLGFALPEEPALHDMVNG